MKIKIKENFSNIMFAKVITCQRSTRRCSTSMRWFWCLRLSFANYFMWRIFRAWISERVGLVDSTLILKRWDDPMCINFWTFCIIPLVFVGVWQNSSKIIVWIGDFVVLCKSLISLDLELHKLRWSMWKSQRRLIQIMQRNILETSSIVKDYKKYKV